MTKFKELGTNQGVRITHPWNDEMYAHNDKVAYHQHLAIKAALLRASEMEDEQMLEQITSAITAYSIHVQDDFQEIYQDALRSLEQMPNHWLHESCWPDLLQANLVDPITISLVGYKN